MKAVDTNVLCHFFVDDPDDARAVQQRPAAVATMSGRVFVPVTVLLEFEWVLRGFYKLPRSDTVRVLRASASAWCGTAFQMGVHRVDGPQEAGVQRYEARVETAERQESRRGRPRF